MSDPPTVNSLSDHEKSENDAGSKAVSPQTSTRSTLVSDTVYNVSTIPILTFTNSIVDGSEKRVQNIELRDNNGDVNSPEPSPLNYKKKNARKREKKKTSNVESPVVVQNVDHPMEITNRIVSTNSVHNFFLTQVTPLYANTNSRYLENLSYHPQFALNNQNHRQQFREVIQNQLASTMFSMPSCYSPQFPQNQSVSFPNTPEPKYLQNVMQHPLLRQSFNIHQNNINSQHLNFNLAHQNNKDVGEHSQIQIKQQNKLKKSSNKNEKLFNSYMSSENVEEGLKNNLLIEGVLRINPNQFQHAYVTSNDRNEQDILIDGMINRNRALEGDVVVVQYIENDKNDADNDSNVNKQKLGQIVYIKEKVHTRTCIGLLKLMPDKNKKRALFVPRDSRIPRLNISFLYWPDNFYERSKDYESTLFLAKIIDWYDVRFAIGKIVCNIGMAGDMQSETKAILAQNDLDVKPYGSEFKHLYPGLDYIVPKEEITLREDCRHLCIFSIDPYNCRDIDDAVSCRKLENGNFEVGVHISDVSHFLTENTPLDEKVAEKATTVYMVETAYHMLPDELCMLCSLVPGVDKIAFSVFWEITDVGQIINHRFAKTVIHSCCQLAYEHAQSILDGKEDIESNFPPIQNGFKFRDVYDTIKVLGKLSSIFRKKRFDDGALRIDQPKISFKLSPVNSMPESFGIYESKESHQLIEEFMLLANMTVAEKIYNDYPTLAFLRCHPPPSLYMLKQLATSLKPMGIDLEISSAGDLHKSLLPHVGPENTDKGKAMVINMLCAKPMTRAKYFCAGCYEEEFSHYALNVPLYTHFTSPIRRYADIMVHRLLAASLNYTEVPKWEVDKIRLIAAQCNKQKYNAKKAGEMSTELYTLKYIELHSPVVTEAVVVDIREKYLDVIIVAMGLNRRIFLNNDFPGTYKCVKNDAGIRLSRMELEWSAVEDMPSVRQTIEVFSILNVKMHKGDDMVKVETKLVRPQ